MKPLEDVRIIAIEQYGAGPWGSVQLADLGAEVIKIEDPSVGGDIGRYVPPYGEGEDSLFFEVFNRNKRSLSLDLASEPGRQVFEDLVRVSDAVYSNLRGDVPSKIGITFDDLRHLNPKIVCCSLSGYGMTGPRAKDPGYDYLLQGIAGWMDVTGEPDGPPGRSGLSMVDYSGGYVAAISLLAAIHGARRDGVGMDCDVSLYDTAISLLNYPATWALNTDFTPARTKSAAHPSLVPFQAFPTRDHWIVVACAKQKFWERLAPVVGHPEWLEDPRYSSFETRRLNSEQLLSELTDVFASRDSAEWLRILGDSSIPCGPINTVREALADPQTQARELIVEVEHPRFGRVRQPRSAVSAGPQMTAHRRAPIRNEDCDYVLQGLLGYSAEETAVLVGRGAFGEATPAAPAKGARTSQP